MADGQNSNGFEIQTERDRKGAITWYGISHMLRYVINEFTWKLRKASESIKLINCVICFVLWCRRLWNIFYRNHRNFSTTSIKCRSILSFNWFWIMLRARACSFKLLIQFFILTKFPRNIVAFIHNFHQHVKLMMLMMITSFSFHSKQTAIDVFQAAE